MNLEKSFSLVHLNKFLSEIVTFHTHTQYWISLMKFKISMLVRLN